MAGVKAGCVHEKRGWLILQWPPSTTRALCSGVYQFLIYSTLVLIVCPTNVYAVTAGLPKVNCHNLLQNQSIKNTTNQWWLETEKQRVNQASPSPRNTPSVCWHVLWILSLATQARQTGVLRISENVYLLRSTIFPTLNNSSGIWRRFSLNRHSPIVDILKQF